MVKKEKKDTFLETKDLDVKVGDIYYADCGYNRVSPRFYKVSNITKCFVSFEPVDGLHVHYKRGELKYASNSPEYYVIPMPENFNQFYWDTRDDVLLETNIGKCVYEFHYVDEDNGYYPCKNYHDAFKSKVYTYKDKKYLKEPGIYGDTLRKYKDGTAIFGCFD